MGFNAGAIEATLTLDRSSFNRELRAARESARRPIDITARLDTTAANAHLRAFQRGLSRGRNYLEIDTTGAEAKLLAIGSMADALRVSIGRSMGVDVDTGAAMASVAALKARIDSLDRGPVRVGPVVGGGGGGSVGGTGAMGALAATNLGQSRLALGAGLAALPAIVPAVTGATAALGGLASAFTAAAGGAGVLGAGIIGAVQNYKKISDATEATKIRIANLRAEIANTDDLEERAALTAELAREQTTLNALLEATTPAMEAMGTALDNVSGSWYNFRQATQEAGLGLATDFLNIAADLLPRLVPIFDAFAEVASRALGSLSDFLGGPEGQRMLDFFERGSVSFDLILQLSGNLLLTLGRLFEAFQPFGEELLVGLVKLTAGWADWADGLGETEKFNAFLDYVREEGPEFLDLLGSIWDAMINIGKAVAPVAGPMMDFFQFLFDGIANMDPSVLGALITGIGAATIAVGLLTGAILIFNVIAAANPISLIVGAIGGLVAAIVYLWHNNEDFKEGVLTAWEAIRETTSGVVSWFLSDALPFLLQVWEGIKAGFESMAASMSAAWDTYGKPLFETIISVVSTMWANGQLVFGFMADAFGFLWGLVSTTWTNVGAPVFGTIVAVLQNLWGKIAEPILRWIGERFASLVQGIKTAWEVVGQPVFELVGAVVSALWEAFVKPAMDKIQERWSTLSAAFKAVWDSFLGPLFETVMDVIGNQVVAAFEDGVDLIGSAWNKLQELAYKPIKFVVGVINEGIIDNFNELARFFGTTEIPRIPEPTAPGAYTPPKQVRGAAGSSSRATEFATGGMMPGYTPGKDVHEFFSPTAGVLRLSGGEPVLRPEAGRVLGVNWVDGINAAARNGGTGGVEQFLGSQAFATGGMVALGRQIQKQFGARVSEHPAFGGVGRHSPTSAHYSGNALDINTRPGQSAAEQRELAVINEWARRQGYNTIFMAPDHYNHLHIDNRKPLASYRGVKIPMAGLASGAGVGGGPGLFGGVVGSMLDNAAEFLGDKIGGLLKKASDTPIMGMLGAVPKKLIEGAVAKIQEIGNANTGGDTGEGFNPEGTGVERWRGLAIQALEMTGHTPTTALVNTMLRRMNQESSGNPRAMNDWDSNAAQGYDMRSKGLMQVIGPTFRANAMPGYNKDIWDPLSNMLAAIRYTDKRYSSLSAGWNRKGGYFNGGHLPIDLSNLGVFDTGGMLQPGQMGINLSKDPEPVFTGAQHRRNQDETAELKEMLRLALTAPRGGGGALVGRDLILQAKEGQSVDEQFDDILYRLRRAKSGGLS